MHEQISPSYRAAGGQETSRQPSELRSLLVSLSDNLPTKKGGAWSLPVACWRASLSSVLALLVRKHPLDVTQGAHMGTPKKIAVQDDMRVMWEGDRSQKEQGGIIKNCKDQTSEADTQQEAVP